MTLETFIYGYIVREEVFPDQATIFEEGKYGDWVYIVMEGRVKTKKRTSKGMLTINTLGEGSVLGELPFLRRTRRTASVIADGEVKLGLLDKDRLEKEYEALSPQLKSLVTTTVLLLEKATTKISELAAS
ncbi:MAG: cyclic nucleotide-binding domain-containing protein [Deltaproteobacteria bacterium]|nr:MAG: cyclic nucleotide-binding domain-containing protein [Deltaproteobacteria bacterium]